MEKQNALLKKIEGFDNLKQIAEGLGLDDETLAERITDKDGNVGFKLSVDNKGSYVSEIEHISLSSNGDTCYTTVCYRYMIGGEQMRNISRCRQHGVLREKNTLYVDDILRLNK